MGNFEAGQYRDNLAREIRQEPDRMKRREIMVAAKATGEYQEARESWRREERPFWGEFSGGETDDAGEYTEPTPEQKEKFQERNERMSEIFEQADFQWYLDGAVNISLYGDRQIRDHKDLDMSIFKEDLAKLEELLARQGFRIFINYEKDGRGFMRAATTEEIVALDKPDLSICKVGQGGKIQKEASEPFNFVDLHVHDKDAAGNTVINYSGAILPRDFFIPIKKELANGKEIDLSQPAVVAYHKLHSDRPYDLTDLQKLRLYLREKDFDMLREALEQEIEVSEKKVKEKLREAWDSLSLEREAAHDPKVIAEKLWTHPDLRTRRDDPKVSEYVSEISRYLSENPKTSRDDFIARSLSLLRVREQIEEKLKAISQLEKNQK